MTIVPSADRSADEQTKLQEFRPDKVEIPDLGALMEEAKLQMGMDEKSSDFSKDIL